MLTVLALSLGVSLLAAVYGRAVLALYRRLAGLPPAHAGGSKPPAADGGQPDPLPALPVQALVGLGALAAGAGLLALVTRLGAGALAAALAGGAALAWGDRRALAAGLGRALRQWRASVAGSGGPGGLGLAALLLGALLALAFAALPPANYDTGAYHAQSVRWLEEFGLVPGLGNLHDRLAFPAGWFVPAALFSLAFLGGPSLHVLNGTLALLLLAWAAGALAAWRRGERSASLLLRLILPAAALALFGRWLSSPAPDVAVAVLLWTAVALTLENAEEDAGRTGPAPEPTSGSGLARTGAVAALAGFAVAVKLSALPALLLPALLAARQIAAGRRRAALATAALAALLALPILPQAVVTTGHPVFPLPGLDPLDLDWEMPAWLVERQARWIPTWARVPHRPTAEVEAMAAAAWLPLWWEHLPGSARAALAAVLVLAPLRLLLLLARRGGPSGSRHPSRSGAPSRLGLEAVLLAGLAFWFALAPDPRFGWGFLLPLAVLLADGVARSPGRPRPQGLRSSFPALPGAALLAAFAVQAWQVHSWQPRAFPAAARHLLLPADYPRPDGLREVTVGGGLRVQVPFPNDRCWYHPFPCTPMPDPRLEPRGPTLADGFRMRPGPAPPPEPRPRFRVHPRLGS